MKSPLATLAYAAILAGITQIQAREITFPPQVPIHGGPNYHASFEVPGLHPEIHNSKFTGLSTFANLPYVYCLDDAKDEDVERFDIAFLGAGFDTVSLIFFCYLLVSGKGALGWRVP
jgi:agmatinase